jgi:hypothetical protein
MPPRNRIKVSCSYCGQEIELAPWRIKHATNPCCSKNCQHKLKGMLRKGIPRPHVTPRPILHFVEVSCDCCKKPYLCPQDQLDGDRHYCSRKCAGHGYSLLYKGKNHPLYSHVTTNCDQCGIEILVRPRDMKNRTHHFCGRKCASAFHSNALTGPNHPGWKGGDIRYYGPNWYEQRRQVRKRDSYKCQCCGVSEKKLKQELDVHHIKPFRDFGVENYLEANQLSNLIALCRMCHLGVENGNIPLQPRLL